MIYLVSMLGVFALLGCAVAVILMTLGDHGDAVVAALAGRSFRAEAMTLPQRRVRVTVRTPVRRPVCVEPMRAAA